MVESVQGAEKKTDACGPNITPIYLVPLLVLSVIHILIGVGKEGGVGGTSKVMVVKDGVK